MENKSVIDKALEYLSPRYDLSLEDVRCLLELKEKHKQEIIEAYKEGTKSIYCYEIGERLEIETEAKEWYKNTFNQLNK